MGPVKVLGRAVQKVADSIMMTLIGNDAMYIYNVSWVISSASMCSAVPFALIDEGRGKAPHPL